MMATIEPVGEKHWKIFLSGKSKCDTTVEVHLSHEQVIQIHKVANQRLFGSGAPAVDFPTAVMILLSAPK